MFDGCPVMMCPIDAIIDLILVIVLLTNIQRSE